MSKFVKRKELANAHVCRDIMRPKVKTYMPRKAVTYHRINLRIPDEYAFALMKMYGKGLQGAIMHHIKLTVTPDENSLT